MCCLTGDLGEKLSNGLIIYHGRRDNMVKTRGYRVEIGEVENAISSIDGVIQAAVIAKPDQKYSNVLHAFVIIKNNLFSIEQLLEALANKLPSYMLPYQFHRVSDLPKTSTGKVDRVSLQEWIDGK